MAIGDLFRKMKEGMMDDKGLFQGGKQGQSCGRIKDVLGMSPKDRGGNRVSRDVSMEADQGLWQHAKDFAANIDVESGEDVGELQSLMNQLGITDEEGGSFKEDSILGAKTMQGLRQLQGADDNAWRSGPRESEEWEGDEGSSSMTWLQKLFGGQGGMAERTKNRMFNRTSDNTGPGVKYQRKNPYGGEDDIAGPGYK